MSATHLPPNPYLERHSFRSSVPLDHDRTARAVVIAVLVLLSLLAVAAAGGAIWLLPDYLQQKQVEARMGPKMNLYTLPEVKVELGGGGGGGGGGAGVAVDMTLKVQLEPGYKGRKIDPYTDRITDRLGDRVREVGIERLQSREGAELVKSMTKSILRQEVPGIKLKDVLIDNLIVRTPYSMTPAQLPSLASWSRWPGVLTNAAG